MRQGLVATPLLAGLALVLSISAGARPAAVDLEMNIGASTSFGGSIVVTPRGGTATVTRKNFVVHASIDLVTALPARRPSFALELGDGFRWGADAPDAPDDCTSTPTTALCKTPVDLQPGAGQSSATYYFDVVAAQNGSYSYSGEIVEAADVDPVLTNNSSTITVVVNESVGGEGGSGGGAEEAAVTTTAAKLVPAAPKAGSTIVASVRVTRGGSPLRPTGVSCRASIGGSKVKSSPRTGTGLASCVVKTPRSARAKLLRGTIGFRAGGNSFTKRYATRLR
jgi:hypothetical protein